MEINEGFIVCNYQIKEKILKTIKGFKRYIFIDEVTLRTKLTFKVKRKAIFLLMKKYGFSYDLALDYYKGISMIKNQQYNDVKLDSLVSCYNYLLKEKMIEIDDLFINKLKQYPVTFINPSYGNEYNDLKELVAKYTKVYEFKMHSNYLPNVFEFNDILKESLFVFNQIKNLLRQGVSCNKIYIVNLNEEYTFLFKRIAKNFKIACNFPSSTNVLSCGIIKKFLEACKEEDNFNSIVSNLNFKDILYKEIIDIINEYDLINENPNNCIDFLNGIFKNTKYPSAEYEKAINFADYNNIFLDDEYVFYIGFNLGSAPSILKEQGFLNDSILKKLNFNTSFETNQINFKIIENLIRNTKNLTLTYKLKSQTSDFYPSLLVSQLQLPIVKVEVDYLYSKIEDDLRLTKDYENYLKFGTNSSNLNKYGLDDIDYAKYDHKYKMISQELLKRRFIEKPLKLAYSNLKLFFACPFSYYADRILNLNEFKPQMAARLGSYSHAVLEDSYKEDFDFENSVNKNKELYSTDAKDDFFFDKMKDTLRNIIAFNKDHEQTSDLKEIKTEEHIIVEKPEFTFEGYIDKLMYAVKDDNVYVAIVDYKTGQDVVSLNNIEDGFNLQLPSYMYLLANYEPFKGLKLNIIGIYLQKVNIVIFDDKTDIEKQLAKKFMLEGYTVADISLINTLDKTFYNSTYIKSLSFGEKGFGAYTKVYKKDKQQEIINLVENLVSNAAKDIKNGEFKITSKIIDNKNKSCTFCKYKDICFRDYSDDVELQLKQFGKEE